MKHNVKQVKDVTGELHKMNMPMRRDGFSEQISKWWKWAYWMILVRLQHKPYDISHEQTESIFGRDTEVLPINSNLTKKIIVY